MDVGCNTYSVHDLERAAAFVRLGALGFTAIELWTGHASYLRDDADPVAVRDEARACGLELRAYCVGGLFGLPRPRVEAQLERAFAFARGLGVDLVTGIVDRAHVGLVDELCARHDVRFGIENHWYTEFARPADYRDALATTSPAVGVTIDTGHFAFLGCDLATVAQTLGSRTLNVHLKVVRPCGPLGRLVRRRRRRFRMAPALPGPTDGLAAFVGALRAVGYRGLLAVEHEVGSEATSALTAYRTRALELGAGERTDCASEARAHG